MVSSSAASPAPIAPGGRRARPGWLAAVLIAVVVLVYWNSLDAPFLFDDEGAVLRNPTIRRLDSLAIFQPPADGSTTTGRPVVNASFALNYAVSGDRAWSYHALNLAIHALAALTLFGLVRRTLLALNSQLSTLSSFSTAALWALHPLQTESVVCIAQRTEALASLFYLLTLYAFARAAQCHLLDDTSGGGARGRRWRWLVLSVGACLLGMGTKEIVATAPLLVLLYDRTFFAGTFAATWRARRGYYLALGATWLWLAWLVAGGGGARGVAAGFGLGVSWWHYLLKQCEAIVLYLQLALWPHPLVLDYGTAVVRSVADVWWQGAIVLALLGATVWALVRKPRAGFIGAWFFVILAPSSSFVPLVTQTMAEHRMYLPLAAIVCLVVMFAHHRLGARAGWLLGATAVVLAATTVARNRDYRDAVTIWSASVADYPTSARAHNNLAIALQHRGRAADAHRHFSRAVELDPGYATGRYNWGATLLEAGRVPEAIVQLEEAIRLAPAHADAHVNLGNALLRAQRPAEALPHYETALQLQPGADVHFNLGVALLDLRRADEAAAHLRTAVQLDPTLAEAHFQLGRAAELTGQPAEAEREFAATVRLAPGHLAAHRRLALLYARSERLTPAAEHFRAVLRLSPDDADAQANLGNVLLLQGDARAAIAAYEAALRLRPGDARVRASLQAARDSLH